MGERLLLVSTNYAPEQAGIGPYATQIAEHLATRRAAEVHVLAGMPHYPAWRLDPAYRGRWRAEERRAGVLVHRRRHSVPPRQTAARRALYEASILAGGLVAPPRMARPHAVLAQVPSLAGGVLAARIARRHRVPYLPIVQDLMGAAAAQSGISGGGRAASAASAVERRVLRGATLVGVIHDSFRDRVRALGVPPERIRLVPNWSHVRAPSPGARAATRERLGWPPEATVVLHSGNMGLKQGLDVLIDAAREAPELRVVLMGDGSQRARLAARAERLPNVTLLPPAADADFPEVLAAADVLVVTQRAAVLDMSVPSKLTSYFAAGRPVLASVAAEGGTAAEVRRSDAGRLVPPEDPAALAAAARKLAADPAAADALGARGAAYARDHLSRAAGLGRVTALLDEALALAADARRNGEGS
ncbi:glycosyltransferase [Streptomyces radicis]|uniref:D-inositol 3-phosphate glycosyltransferase n=1 Tax=Streptomyces radicis TaxID=1750517 RepID=A0A3A9WGH2_9ACTN|nr:glycosyltransferase [Streptomyces radicis]RKN12128.1 glycosyltransferase WbuB [Streptomyces radicis]RKN25819.1 glycosyltransferase WbuB [Streptomyces radicis]